MCMYWVSGNWQSGNWQPGSSNLEQSSSLGACHAACVQASSASGELLRDAAVNMHSALQQLVDDSCRRAGKAPWILRDAQGYELVFKAHCSRKGHKGAAAGPHVHVSFTRDDYLRGCELLVASSDPLDARTLSLTTYQAATVSRGDDVRPRHLAELSWRFLGSVGECNLSVGLQPESGGQWLQRCMG